MQQDVQAQSAPAATGISHDAVSAAADPWDAPYFGAPVYFTYRASAAPEGHATASAGASAPRAADEWARFPLLGGPSYDGFPPFAPASSTVDSGALSVTGPALDTLHPPHFGAPVYLTYEPGIPRFAREPATPSSAAHGAAAPIPPASQPRTPAGAGRATRRGGWLARLLGHHG
ncbi:MAG TPA: hypothetical protein VGR57_21110 [Ktedonobacterales bacterium]|nr:hypothetical protein [Ktedonobacterales bacterium]